MRVLPTRWQRKPAGIDTSRNYATVALCIQFTSVGTSRVKRAERVTTSTPNHIAVNARRITSETTARLVRLLLRLYHYYYFYYYYYYLAHQHKACRQLKIKQEMTAVGD